MEPTNQSPIAVVGVAYRAPGTGRKGLHDFLAKAKSAFSPIPKDRFQEEAYSYNDSEKPGVFAAKGAYFLPGDVYAFDAPFFNMNGEEVTSMDPQHRTLNPTAADRHRQDDALTAGRNDARMCSGSSRKRRHPSGDARWVEHWCFLRRRDVRVRRQIRRRPPVSPRRLTSVFADSNEKLAPSQSTAPPAFRDACFQTASLTSWTFAGRASRWTQRARAARTRSTSRAGPCSRKSATPPLWAPPRSSSTTTRS